MADAGFHSSHAVRSRVGGILLKVWAYLVFAFLLLPLLVVVPISFSGGAYVRFPPTSYSLQWYQAYLGDPAWINATLLSLKIGFASTFLTMLLGLPFALAVTHGLRRWSGVLEKLAMAPMIVPTIVYAVSMYALYSDLGLVGNWYGIALAHAVTCLPFVTVVLCAGLRDFDIDQEHAAIGLGASRLVAFWRITLPQIRSSVYSAAFLAFIMSFDELVISMFLSGSFGTLPKKMFDNVRLQVDPTIAAVSVLEIGAVLISMLILLRYNKNKPATIS